MQKQQTNMVEIPAKIIVNPIPVNAGFDGDICNTFKPNKMK